MNMLHTCYRIGDIDHSIKFYSLLGFKEVRRMKLPDGATNVFLNIPGDDYALELTKNPGIDNYDLGSGYGHVALKVTNFEQVLEGLKRQGVTPEKPPYTVSDGGSRICFLQDPDGYRIELIESK